MTENQDVIKGTVFDIKEFAVHDGPGIRTTIFMKGCPLECTWCHNPEGILPEPQMIKSPAGERIVGDYYTPENLAKYLNNQAHILKANEGGVTFSGGEPLMQAQFVSEVIDLLPDEIHILIDTSGQAEEDDFRMVIQKSDLVYFDLKVLDRELHEKYTKNSNELILNNLNILETMNVPFVIRIPLVPGVTDTDTNFKAIINLVRNFKNLQNIDLLPYNPAAGGKYASAGMDFNPGFDENRAVNKNLKIFEDAGIKIKIV